MRLFSVLLRRALQAPVSSGPQRAPPLQLQEWLSGSPQNLGSGSHLVLNFVQEANPRWGVLRRMALGPRMQYQLEHVSE